MNSRKKGFTLIELIAVLVILAILALIVTPLVMNIIRKAKISADRRSVDSYGRSVELAIATHLLDTGTFPTDLKNLNVEYTGKTVSCNIMQMKENGGIYLSECTVGTKEVKDSSTEDGWYHYGTRDLTNEEYVDMYGLALKTASVAYYNTNGNPVEDYTTLTIEYTGKVVVCNVMQMKENGGIYLSECSVGTKAVKDSSTEDGWYHYGTRDITNEEYVDMYGLALKTASVAYYNTNGNPVSDYTTLTIDYTGKPVSCDVTVNYDGSIYMTKCKVNNVDVTSDTEDGYYHYGSIVNPPSAVNDLLAKANSVTVTNYTDGNTKEMYTFEHPATTQTGALTDYRYIGANPNNYVIFNNELWRIIGVFTVEDGNGNTEQRIKIVRNEKLSSNMIWDSNGVNEWSTATLNTYLNGEYYNGLDATSKSMIADTKYYLGGRAYSGNPPYGTSPDMYAWERGTTVYSGRSTSWNGKIALMYPSDYTYTYALGVDNTCYTDGYNCRTNKGGTPTKGWIYNTNSNSTEWLLSPTSGSSYSAFNLSVSGSVSHYGSFNSTGVRPSLYLVSNIKIDSGEGTEQSPYRLKL